MYDARELAMTRMEEEADELGADGVVGVRLEIGEHNWGNHVLEFVAMGTAIKHRDGVMHRSPDGRPFTSDLSGQDFWTLMRTGHRPVGLVMGNCVYHVAYQGLRGVKTVGRNAEMKSYTQALYAARELAMSRMQDEADSIGAKGIVGLQLHEKNHGWGSHAIEFFAIGTAIVASETAAVHDSPTAVVNLSGS